MKSTRTNEEMYQGFLDGDIDSFSELVLANRNLVIFLIKQYIEDEFIAEDLCQEIFIRIFQHKENYKKEYTFRSYLRMLVRYESYDYIRKLQKEKGIERLEDLEEYPSDVSIEDGIFDELDKQQIRAAIKMLKKEYQEVIYYIEYEKMSYKKTANIMGKSIMQINVLIYRAKQRIKFIMESRGDKSEKR